MNQSDFTKVVPTYAHVENSENCGKLFFTDQVVRIGNADDRVGRGVCGKRVFELALSNFA